MPEILVAGELYADLIMSGFDSWPAPGQEAFAREFHREIGGGAAITACGLARLGSRSGVVGAVGADGAWLIETLRAAGVDTSGIGARAEEPTGFTVAATTPADRAFLTYRGANRFLPDLLADLPVPGRLNGTRHLHLACAPDLGDLAELLQAIRRQACTTSLDAGWHPDWLADPRAMSLLPLVDLFFPNEAEGRRMTGATDPRRTLERLSGAGARRVALKLGERGAALLWDGEILFGAPPPVTPVDTTGAGDCFDAGFLHAWLRGASPRLCLRTANICGAISTEAYGGIAAFPAAARVERELEEQSCER
jgi:ribokinase